MDNPNSPFSHLVNFDATCSGIQHISGLLQDKKRKEEGLGELVNIKSSDE